MTHPAATNCSELLEQARCAFEQRFHQSAEFGALAPGRVNLIGEHTDYNGGFVMPLAIDRHTVVLASPSAQRKSVLWARDLHQEQTIDLTSELSPPAGSFATYVLAVVAQFKVRIGSMRNFNLMITGNIPRGAGLSSSASLEVATATLLQNMFSVHLDPIETALLCQRAEQDFVGVPCGVMDMFISAMARQKHAMLIDCRSLEFQHVQLPDPSQATLLVIDSRVERSLRSGEYAQRRRTCEAAARKLNLGSLRDATEAIIEQSTSLTFEERQRALHVVRENARVLDAARALRSGDMDTLGTCMFQSHASLRDLFQVSIDELDCIVDAAAQRRQKFQDVWGARMTGAGFGGVAIALCQPGAADPVAHDISAAFANRFGREPRIFSVTAVDGATALHLNDS